ncbi:restriction endonuclease subunit S [Elizabethkingia anophelis]|uniref:restriction endonuclease subunit S n=1 Tax=Elizabethkingia anophelis TaxID=1117645 RepID=UPI001EE6DF95|nr:restriction endonuclease subunit S [Elizabethkingia anophelis]MCT3676947.1 restriction endonuclease subunit S [Elizabethkingia anophelis]MCT3684382.1 restriction endonuclease subunit S [Elizabethkingia anophelis]MCT3863149.1 restriction endonuclease subunit S [Elizabethkingia anophelis]MCT3901887.1 restriction endonuclease subunit S [Elizabethkingia anophelis]UKY82200.1 restriction endonuclease subunit S [Elizabethkingia anophelis]
MTEENKNVKKFPNLRFPGFEDEWEEKKLGEIATFSKGKGISKNEIVDNGETECIRYGELYTFYEEVISEIQSKTNTDISSLVLSEANDVIIPASGETQIDIATASCVLKSGVALGGDLNIIKTKNNGIFLSYYLNSKKKLEIAKLSQGISVVHLYSSQLALLNLKLPQFEEQEKLANFLSLLNSRIQTQKKIIEGLSLQKISIVKKLFENKIKFKTDNKTHSWERKKLSEISEEHLHKNPNNKYNEVFSVAKHKGVINQIEHLGRSFSAKEILHYKLVCPGDLVYTKSPTSDFPFGIIKQNRTGRIGVVSPLYCVFTPKTYALGYLLHEYFNSSVNTFNYLNPLVQKGAKNTMNINNEIFLNGASILLPMDEEEQKKIYEILLCLDAKINLETELLTQYENQKKYLLQNLFV